MKVIISKKATKLMSEFPDAVRDRLNEKINAYAQSQDVDGVAQQKDSDTRYRLRDGQYRVIFEVDTDADTMKVLRAGRRRAKQAH